MTMKNTRIFSQLTTVLSATLSTSQSNIQQFGRTLR